MELERMIGTVQGIDFFPIILSHIQIISASMENILKMLRLKL